MLNDLTDMQIYEMVKEIAASNPYADVSNVQTCIMQDFIDDVRRYCKTIEDARRYITLCYSV